MKKKIEFQRITKDSNSFFADINEIIKYKDLIWLFIKRDFVTWSVHCTFTQLMCRALILKLMKSPFCPRLSREMIWLLSRILCRYGQNIWFYVFRNFLAEFRATFPHHAAKAILKYVSRNIAAFFVCACVQRFSVLEHLFSWKMFETWTIIQNRIKKMIHFLFRSFR